MDPESFRKSGSHAEKAASDNMLDPLSQDTRNIMSTHLKNIAKSMHMQGSLFYEDAAKRIAAPDADLNTAEEALKDLALKTIEHDFEDGHAVSIAIKELEKYKQNLQEHREELNKSRTGPTDVLFVNGQSILTGGGYNREL